MTKAGLEMLRILHGKEQTSARELFSKKCLKRRNKANAGETEEGEEEKEEKEQTATARRREGRNRKPEQR